MEQANYIGSTASMDIVFETYGCDAKHSKDNVQVGRHVVCTYMGI